jgi:malate dehydrogenase (oxaloacetate-decarboxylating)
VATGRSEFPNQVNNEVIFHSILRALLDLRAESLEEDTSVAISDPIASLVGDNRLNENYIIPNVNDTRILSIVTQTLKEAFRKHMTKKAWTTVSA